MNKLTLNETEAKLPITAVTFLTPDLVAAGSGTRLLVNSQSWSVLVKNRVHVLLARKGDHSTSWDLLVAGGRELAFGRLTYDQDALTWTNLAKRDLNDWVLSVSYYRDQTIIATASNAVLLLNLSDLSTSQTICCAQRPFVWSAAFSSVEYSRLAVVRLAAGTILQEILVWSPFVSSQVALTLSGHDGSIFDVSFNPSGSKLISASDDRTVRVWDLDSRGPAAVLWGHQGRVWRCKWLNEETVVSCSEDAYVFVWILQNGLYKIKEKLHGHDGKNIWALAVQLEKNSIASGGADSGVRLWNFREDAVPDLQDNVLTMDVSSDGQHLVWLHRDHRLCYSSQKTGSSTLLAYIPPTINLQGFLYLDVDNLLVWAVFKRGDIVCVPFESNKALACFQLDQVISYCHFQKLRFGSARLITYDGRSKTIFMYSLEPYKMPKQTFSRESQTPRPPAYIHTSPSGKLLFAADVLGNLQISIVLDEKNQPLQLACSSSVSTTPTPSYFPRIHQEAITDIFVLEETDAYCIFETIGRDGKWMRHRLIVDHDRLESLVTTSSVTLATDRLEKILIYQKKRYFAAQSNSKYTIYNEYAEKVLTFPAPEPAPVTWRIIPGGVSWILYQVSHFALHTEMQPTSEIIRQPFHGREIRCIKAINYSSEMILVASTTENSILTISRLHDDSRLERLCVETGLRDNIKALNWVETEVGCFLFATGVRDLVQCYAIKVLEPGYLGASITLEFRLCSEDVRSTALADLRIVATDVWPDQKEGVCIASGYSDGTLKIRHYSFSSRKWSTVAQVQPDPEKPRCILSLQYFKTETMHRQQQYLVAGGTDGNLRFWKLEKLEEDTKLEYHFHLAVHQSGVNCFDIKVQDRFVHVVSGGDDNSLCFWKISTTVLEQGSTALVQLHRAASAHASAIQGVRIMPNGNIITSAWDQRCTIWKSDGAKIDSVLTQVADCSALDIVQSGKGLRGLLAGTGWQTVDVY